MLTYQYICKNCNIEFETEQSIKDKPLKKCRKCGKMKLERLLFPVEFFDKTPRTLGALADKKTKDYSYEQEDYLKKIDDQKEVRKAMSREAIKKKLPTAKFKDKSKKETPWYGKIDDKKQKDINSDSSGETLKKYLFEGK